MYYIVEIFFQLVQEFVDKFPKKEITEKDLEM